MMTSPYSVASSLPTLVCSTLLMLVVISSAPRGAHGLDSIQQATIAFRIMEDSNLEGDTNSIWLGRPQLLTLYRICMVDHVYQLLTNMDINNGPRMAGVLMLLTMKGKVAFTKEIQASCPMDKWIPAFSHVLHTLWNERRDDSEDDAIPPAPAVVPDQVNVEVENSHQLKRALEEICEPYTPDEQKPYPYGDEQFLCSLALNNMEQF